jgi:hypothetical protein
MAVQLVADRGRSQLGERRGMARTDRPLLQRLI